MELCPSIPLPSTQQPDQPRLQGHAKKQDKKPFDLFPRSDSLEVKNEVRMSDNEKKAQELVAEADKKLNATKSFLGGLFG